MMTRGCLLLLCLLAACGYSHIAKTVTTFTGHPSAELTLRVEREIDSVVSGPDIVEDQTLVIHLRYFKVGKPVTIPSPNASASFSVSRFGPNSEGTEFKGSIIVRKVEGMKITADLTLDVTAHASSGGYVQRAKFRGEHVFYRTGM